MNLSLLVFVTISAAVVAWALAERFSSRLFWAVGAALTTIHSAAAFHVFYEWSHSTARELTTQQTATLTGITFSGGIYVNYLFLLVWDADALWWCLHRDSYLRRPRWLSHSVRGFLFFIIVNGAVIFADGYARLLGAVATMSVLHSWVIGRPRA